MLGLPLRKSIEEKLPQRNQTRLSIYDYSSIICESVVLGASIYTDVGIRLGTKKSLRSNEFFWAFDFQCTIFALCFIRIFIIIRKCCICRFIRYGCGTYIFLPGRHISKSTRGFQNFENPTNFESAL